MTVNTLKYTLFETVNYITHSKYILQNICVIFQNVGRSPNL
jgi:hypothetical protein